MIDTSKFNLIYYCKETGKEVKACIPETGYIAILDNGTVKKYTTFQGRKLFRGSKENRRAKNKPRYTRPRIAKKGFEEYLNESREKLVSNFY